MYVYCVIANLEDFCGNTVVLNTINASEEDAMKSLVVEQKHYCKGTPLGIKQFRVNKKSEFFVVVDEQEEADVTFNHFLHLSTSEKRANGWKKNHEARNVGCKLKVMKYHLNKV